jgi:acetyl esterase/lipase
MAYSLDPEIPPVPAKPVPADWRAMRESGERAQAALAALLPRAAGVRTAQHLAGSADGTLIKLRWYAPTDGASGGVSAAVVYAHGGGMIMGTLDAYDEVIAGYVTRTGVPFLSVAYRRAPDEGSGTDLAEDVYAGITWLIEHAGPMGVDPLRVAVMGDSGGGGPAAGAAILARDRGVPLARQILVYPMLDDRNVVPDPARSEFLTWTYEDNRIAWDAVLGDRRGAADVSPIAAPARLDDFRGLAPAYLDVGDLDIFRDEDIAYAQRLARAGVPVELHVHPGAPHGWERFAPDAASARQALTDRVRVIAALRESAFVSHRPAATCKTPA